MIMREAILLTAAAILAAPAAGQTHWVATWGASPSPQLAAQEMKTAKLEFENQTLREIVHITIGGNTVRVRLSNAYGKEAVDIGGGGTARRGPTPHPPPRTHPPHPPHTRPPLHRP